MSAIDEMCKLLGIDVTKSPVRAAPLAISDTTSLPILGLTPRQFRTFLRDHGVPFAKIGRRVVARADDVMATIDRLSGRGSVRIEPEPYNEAAIIARAARAREAPVDDRRARKDAKKRMG